MTSISSEAMNEFLNMVRDVFTLTLAIRSKDDVLSMTSFDGFMKHAVALLEARAADTDETMADAPSIVIHKDTTTSVIPNVIVVKDAEDETAQILAMKHEKDVKVEFVPKTSTKAAAPAPAPAPAPTHTADPTDEGNTAAEETQSDAESDAEEPDAEEGDDVEAAEDSADAGEPDAEEDADADAADAEDADAADAGAEDAGAEDAGAEDAGAEDADAEEDDEGVEEIKIGKKLYFIQKSSQVIFARISESEAGDCLGRFQNGKIVPL